MTNENQFKKAGWKTRCLGRHLVDLPSDAKVAGTFKISGAQITRQPFSAHEIEAKLQLVEQQLKADPPKTKGDKQFERSVRYANRSGSVIASQDVFGDTAYHFTTYFGTPDGVTCLFFSGH